MSSLHFKHSLQLFKFRLLFFNFWIMVSCDFSQQKPCNIEHLLQLFRTLQLEVTKLVASIFLKQIKKPTKNDLSTSENYKCSL